MRGRKGEEEGGGKGGEVKGEEEEEGGGDAGHGWKNESPVDSLSGLERAWKV